MLTIRIVPVDKPAIELQCEVGGRAECPTPVAELDWLEIQVRGIEKPGLHRLVLKDRVLAQQSETTILMPDGLYAARWGPSQYFERYAGTAVLQVQSADPPYRPICELALNVEPSKMTLDDLIAIFDLLQEIETGLILDVYAMTEVTLGSGRRIRSLPPEVFLRKAEQSLGQLEQALAEMRARPHHGTREVWLVQPYRPGRTLRPTEIASLCQTPSAFSVTQSTNPDRLKLGELSVAIDWVPTHELVADYDVYEHRIIRTFLEMLERSLDNLADTAYQEFKARDSAKARATTFWKDVDQPRLPLLLDREKDSRLLANKCRMLFRRYPFLTKAGRIAPPARPTPAFTRLSPYRKAYNAVTWFWQEHNEGEIRFIGPGERFNIQDLAQLYEYWGTLTVLRIMLRHFELVSSDTQSFVDLERFVTTLRSGAEAWFRALDGRLIRLRYEPEYKTKNAGGLGVGRRQNYLDRPVWPDLVFELYQKRTDLVPQTVIVTDFKYRRNTASAPAAPEPHPEDLEKIEWYMNAIVDLTKNPPQPLPRHGWIIYPSGLLSLYAEGDIFDPQVSAGSKTSGAIPTVPKGSNELLERTLLRLLSLEGFESSHPRDLP